MCFRSSTTASVKALEQRFRASFATPTEREVFHHVAGFAHPRLPVITATAPATIQLYRWGLIPHWAKTSEQALRLAASTLNARLESIAEKTRFSPGRCQPLPSAGRWLL